MSDIRTPLRQALRDAVKTAWSDVTRIYWPGQLVRLSIEKKAKALQFPIAIIDLSGPNGLRAETSGRNGITNTAQSGMVEIYRLQWDDYTVTTLEQSLVDLEDYLKANQLSYGMRRKNSIYVDPEPNHPSWAYAIETDKPWRLGVVAVRVTVGETR